MGFHSMATQEHDFQIKIHIFHNKQNKIERERDGNRRINIVVTSSSCLECLCASS